MASDNRLSVLIIDASVVYRRLLSDIIAGLGQVGRVSATINAKVALSRMEVTPIDLVIFDLDSSVDQAFGSLEQIREAFPEVMIIAIGGEKKFTAAMAVAAMQSGALQLISKPSDHKDQADLERFSKELGAWLHSIQGRQAAVRARRLAVHPKSPPRSAGTLAPRREPATPTTAPRAEEAGVPRVGNFDIVAIGVSTGGPNALQQVIPCLPANLGAPVLLVQHMPPDFTGALAESLAQRSAIKVVEAHQGETITPGVVYLAPGGKHMVARVIPGLAYGIIGLNSDPPVNSCRPSADVLFKSLAPIFGSRILAVVMTGMGNDGREGVRAIKNKGGYCLNQSENSCVVYGMPRAVDEAGLSDERVPLHRLAERIAALAGARGGG